MGSHSLAFDIGVTLLVVAAMLAVTYLAVRLAMWAGMLSSQTSSGPDRSPPPSRRSLAGKIGMRVVTLAATFIGVLGLDSWHVGPHVLVFAGMLAVGLPCFELYQWRSRTGELYQLLRRR